LPNYRTQAGSFWTRLEAGLKDPPYM
jgi:hypothetical protein